MRVLLQLCVLERCLLDDLDSRFEIRLVPSISTTDKDLGVVCLNPAEAFISTILSQFRSPRC